MKQLLRILICVFLMLSSSRAQEILKVLEIMKAQENAWNEGKIEKFMEPYEKSDSLLFVGRWTEWFVWFCYFSSTKEVFIYIFEIKIIKNTFHHMYIVSTIWHP